MSESWQGSHRTSRHLSLVRRLGLHTENVGFALHDVFPVSWPECIGWTGVLEQESCKEPCLAAFVFYFSMIKHTSLKQAPHPTPSVNTLSYTYMLHSS